jgi:hypothetical protein
MQYWNFAKLIFISAWHSQEHKFCNNGQEHSPFREVKVNSACQEMACILWNMKKHRCVSMSHNWTVPLASPVHFLKFCLLQQPVEYYPTIYSTVSTLPLLNKHHLKAESKSGGNINPLKPTGYVIHHQQV